MTRGIQQDILYWTPFLIVLLVIAFTHAEYRLEILIGALVGVVGWTLISSWSRFVFKAAR